MQRASTGGGGDTSLSPTFYAAERAKERVLAGDAVSVQQLRSKMRAVDRAGRREEDKKGSTSKSNGNGNGNGGGNGGGNGNSSSNSISPLFGRALVPPGFARELVTRVAVEEERRREEGGSDDDDDDDDDDDEGKQGKQGNNNNNSNNKHNNEHDAERPSLRLLSDQTVALFLALQQSLAWLLRRWPGLDGSKTRNRGGGTLATVAAGALLLARSALRCRLHVALSSCTEDGGEGAGEDEEAREGREALAQRQLAGIIPVLLPPRPSWRERGRAKDETTATITATTTAAITTTSWTTDLAQDLQSLQAELFQRRLH